MAPSISKGSNPWLKLILVGLVLQATTPSASSLPSKTLNSQPGLGRNRRKSISAKMPPQRLPLSTLAPSQTQTMRGTKAAGELEAALANLDFDCKNKDAGGYADMTSECAVFHVCSADGHRTTVACPPGKRFSVHSGQCQWWDEVECKATNDESLKAAKAPNEQPIDGIRHSRAGWVPSPFLMDNPNALKSQVQGDYLYFYPRRRRIKCHTCCTEVDDYYQHHYQQQEPITSWVIIPDRPKPQRPRPPSSAAVAAATTPSPVNTWVVQFSTFPPNPYSTTTTRRPWTTSRRPWTPATTTRRPWTTTRRPWANPTWLVTTRRPSAAADPNYPPISEIEIIEAKRNKDISNGSANSP